MKVFKYPFKIDNDIQLEMPEGAELLCVQMQNDRPCLWARVDEAQMRKAIRRISIRGTGHPDADGIYLNTFQMMNGALVFHVFDMGYARS